jgi:hypothetical protein
MENLDDLWPPFGPQAAGQADRAHRLLHERAQAHEARQRPGHDQQARGRGRIAPTLSRAEIVDAAIAVADADGADAVSMRRIAQVLRWAARAGGRAAMSLVDRPARPARRDSAARRRGGAAQAARPASRQRAASAGGDGPDRADAVCAGSRR